MVNVLREQMLVNIQLMNSLNIGGNQEMIIKSQIFIDSSRYVFWTLINPERVGRSLYGITYTV